MATQISNPLVVQSDRTLLLEVDHPLYAEARDALAQFAELEKSPEHIHTYRLSPLSLWNAAAAGLDAAQVIDSLARFSKYDLPPNVVSDLRDYIGRYGRLKLERETIGVDGRGEGALLLRSTDATLIAQVSRQKRLQPFILAERDPNTLEIDPARRGHVKQELIAIGFPAEDLAGYTDGARLAVTLRDYATSGADFVMRPYQADAVAAFYANGAVSGGSGVVVLPCGAGKTIVGAGAMAAVGRSTLILTPSTIAVRQWIAELLDKTTLTADQVGEYTGERKDIRPVTVTTYQMLTYRPSESSEFPHFGLVTGHDWGLIVYDEVHLLPAPIFRITAEIQARRRLGLTATLVREDGREADVFGLIGPKRFDMPWRELERQGWIATAECHEIRVPLPDDERLPYAITEEREKYRIAAENPLKTPVTQALLDQHADDQILIIGQYLDQLKNLADLLDAPLLTGRTNNAQREKLYDQFRRGEIKRLVVSKVANFAVDLPDANVAIQVSGTFGSRQEEAQRLGRLLRPKADGRPAHFYTIVTRDTRDQEFSANRQLFLTEQGYRYTIEDAEDLFALDPSAPIARPSPPVAAPASRANGKANGAHPPGDNRVGVNGKHAATAGKRGKSAHIGAVDANGANGASANGAASNGATHHADATPLPAQLASRAGRTRRPRPPAQEP
ncbi:MAG TPA: DNA repair helicase XPB [Ktedonobacterales bacterium]|nr:DNA repair helicase XPB [Ktedonobacterales bacterium]